jgi:ESCRT-II complex subunit VPS36
VDLAREHADGIGAAEAARRVGMTPSIAREQLLAAEQQGALCRDEAADGIRFFMNRFRA